MPYALLLAMQAAGMVTDWFGTRNQQRIGDMGARLQQAGIEADIQQTRLEAEDASLQAMKDLRRNLGTQAAVFAARGTRPGAGSALSLSTESIGNFNSDERMRRMNQLGRETALRAGKSIAKLNQQSTNANLWKGFASRTLNTFGTGYLYDQATKSFGLTSKGA